jgi:ABC-type antimicrobial peptide transport system permease subunit
LLAVIFSGLALLLSGVGTYGVTSYAVAQRRREISIRMALGAEPAHIRRQFVAAGARLCALGTSVGLIGAVIAGLAMRGLLFRVSVFDARVLCGSILVMTLVAFSGCVLPAVRAARVAPAEVLAAE